MKSYCFLILFLFGIAVSFVFSQDDTSEITINENVVVSATKTPEDAQEVPGSATVITGEELKRTGAKTIAEAIQDVVGIDTANGSDEGPRLANIGMWGLKEFDALLVTVDGIPVGGPFNPSLSQINIDDVERIEIVKGPQGTLYGVSAFAGMIQVFTRKVHAEKGGAVTGSVGSFSSGYGSASYSTPVSENTNLRFYGAVGRADGWQDRTGLDEDRFKFDFQHNLDKSKFALSFMGSRYDQDWGSPIPVDGGEIVPGFEIDRNYAIGEAHAQHHLFGINSNYSRELADRFEFQNLAGFTRDNQDYLRSFITFTDSNGINVGGESEGIFLQPEETTFFEEARIIRSIDAHGTHRLVAGGAVTWGRTEAEGHGFDFEFDAQPAVEVPNFDEIIAFGDNRGFKDDRTFLGFYARDEWNIHPRVELSGGVRVDRTSEDLEAEFEELGGGDEGEGVEGTTTDSRSDTKLSGDGSILYRLVQPSSRQGDRVNIYFSAKSTFKPAAPNLTEAENAEILKPERARSIEGGIKTRMFEEQLWLDASLFRMDFKNLVVSTQNQDGEPELVNAGEERFTGIEFDVQYHPLSYEDLYIRAGYAHHSPKFVQFTFFTPDGQFRDVSGNFLELAPRNLFNARVVYAPKHSLGGFVAVRFQGERFLNRRNTFLTESFTEWDAGISYEISRVRLQFTGRNLGNKRYFATESEIGDSQFYIAAPRRFSFDATWSF